jgi:hypothetical protein
VSWLFGLLTNLPGFLNGVLAYLNKKQDTALEQFRIGNTNGRDVSIEVVKAELARQNALRDVTVSAMSHPIWWVAWALGVFPVLTYEAAIFWVSTFPGLGWTIQKVPADQQAFAVMVCQWMFGISGASALVSGIAKTWSKRA